jgi:hypothetical protein
MRLTIVTDDLQRLICTLSEGECHATVTASNTHEAAAGLVAAMEDALKDGCGECFWDEAGGQYRWVMKREGEKVKLAVIWSSGVITGWEHVFWTECDFADLAGQIHTALAALPAAVIG